MNSKKSETASTQPNSQIDIQQSIKSLTVQIHQNPCLQSNYQKYISRSQMYTIANDKKSAIIDLSKSLYIQPTYSAYVQRGKLLVEDEKYVDGLLDFQEAKRIFRGDKQKENKGKDYLGEEHEDWDIRKPLVIPRIASAQKAENQIKDFLSSSTLMLNLGEIKSIAEEHEQIRDYMSKEYNVGMSNAFTRLIEEKVNRKVDQKVKQIESNLMKQFNNLRKHFEGEIEKVKKKQYENENYYFVFKDEIENGTLSQTNKHKYNVYFDCVVLELEKFYLSAEILSKYEEKISFQDCQGKIKQREHIKVGFIEKIYKMFEKNSQKIQKAGEIVKEIPYIGTMFKVIKNTLHCLGWIKEIKNESECKNIMRIRPSLQQFNKLSYIVGYQLYKYFKIDIVSDLNGERYNKNIWCKASELVNKYETNNVVNHIHPHVKYYDDGGIEEMGKTHVAIFMATIAYGLFQMPAYGQVSGYDWGQIMDLIRDVETSFMPNKENQTVGQQTVQVKEEGKSEGKEQTAKNQKSLVKESKCEIF